MLYSEFSAEKFLNLANLKREYNFGFSSSESVNDIEGRRILSTRFE